MLLFDSLYNHHIRSLAGYATQGVRGAHVVSHRSSPVSKKKKKSVAYVVFCGLKCGVFATWCVSDPTIPLAMPNFYTGTRWNLL